MINKKSVFYSSMLLTISAVILQLLGFAYRILLSRLLNPQDMGVYQLVLPFYSILSAFCLSGFTMAVSRICAEQSGSTRSVRKTMRLSVMLFLCIYGITAGAVLLFADQFNRAALKGSAKTALLLLLPCLLLTGFENLMKACFHGVKFVLPPMISEISEQLVRMIAVGFLLSTLHPTGADAVCAAIVAGMIVSEIVSDTLLFCFYRGWSKRNPPQGSVPADLLSQIAAVAVPICLGGLLNNLLSGVNHMLIPQRLVAYGATPAQAMADFGILMGMTFPLLLLPSCFVFPLTTVILPRIAASARHNLPDVRRKIAKTYHTIGLIAIPITLFMCFFGRDIAALLYRNPLAARGMLPLAAACLLNFYYSASAGILNALGRQKRVVVNFVLIGVLELAFTYIFTGGFGLTGYMIGFLLTTILGAADLFLRVRKAVKLQIQWKNWLITPTLAALFATFTAYLSFFSHTPLGILLAVLLAAAAYLAALRFLGVGARK